jgi:hypothetical protein
MRVGVIFSFLAFLYRNKTCKRPTSPIGLCFPIASLLFMVLTIVFCGNEGNLRHRADTVNSAGN